MKIIVEAEELTGVNGEAPHKAQIAFSEIGAEAWVRIDVGGKSYDVDYREFWDAARAVCVSSYFD